MTLAEFLAARIDEDKAAAGDVHRRDCRIFVQLTTADCSCDLPSRVLAECRAKRWIVEALAPYAGKSDPEWTDSDDTLQCLASVYADHPDYRDEWRP